MLFLLKNMFCYQLGIESLISLIVLGVCVMCFAESALWFIPSAFGFVPSALGFVPSALGFVPSALGLSPNSFNFILFLF